MPELTPASKAVGSAAPKPLEAKYAGLEAFQCAACLGNCSNLPASLSLFLCFFQFIFLAAANGFILYNIHAESTAGIPHPPRNKNNGHISLRPSPRPSWDCLPQPISSPFLELSSTSSSSRKREEQKHLLSTIMSGKSLCSVSSPPPGSKPSVRRTLMQRVLFSSPALTPIPRKHS